MPWTLRSWQGCCPERRVAKSWTTGLTGNFDWDLTWTPQAFQLTVRSNQRIVADGWEMIEFICHENKTFLKLTGRAPT